jgi:hypothetical protein
MSCATPAALLTGSGVPESASICHRGLCRHVSFPQSDGGGLHPARNARCGRPSPIRSAVQNAAARDRQFGVPDVS